MIDILLAARLSLCFIRSFNMRASLRSRPGLVGVLFAAGAFLVCPTTAAARDLAACSAPVGERAGAEGVTVVDVPASPGDLPGLRAISVATGAHMTIHYDAASEAAARARAACLGAQLGLLELETADDRRGAQWDSVVFTTDSGYVPPRTEGEQGRWTVVTTPGGGLDERAEMTIVTVMPHEQLHEFQGRLGARTPRWFHEGHATWAGVKVSAQLSTAAAAQEIATLETALSASTAPLALGAWGGVRVRPEAILRQLSPEDRARRLADPSFSPKGPFSFKPEDFISDESNTPARYAGAWKIFKGLEARHGAEAVRNWVAELTATSERVDNAAIIASAQARFNEDIAPLLE